MGYSTIHIIILILFMSIVPDKADDQVYWDPREWYWPQSSYGLPQSTAGCPGGATFHDGWRYHDTEDFNPSNEWSNPLHLRGSWGRNNMQWHFCMKTDNSGASEYFDWQPGKYCLFKKGGCPPGFNQGSIYWDDEDLFNANKAGGVLPDGTYNRNTLIYFCCRNDGEVENTITVPLHVTRDFFLFPLHDYQCQAVQSATLTLEWFKWDTEDTNNKDSWSWPHPRDRNAGRRDPYVYFCYYEFQDQDECADMNGGCSQGCHDTVGSYYCSCGDGYVLEEDRHTCRALSCGHPGEITDGTVTGTWLYDTYAQYDCPNSAFSLVGYQYRKCNAIGTNMFWEQSSPECKDTCMDSSETACGSPGTGEVQCLQLGCCYDSQKQRCTRKQDGIYGQYTQLKPNDDGFQMQKWSSAKGCQYMCDFDYREQCKAFYMYRTNVEGDLVFADCHLLEHDLKYYQNAGLISEDIYSTFYNKLAL